MNIYFGENLKALRQKRNLTQEKLAEFLNVSFQTISKWERGDTYPDISMLPEIALFFKVSVDDLLGVNKAENEEKLLVNTFLVAARAALVIKRKADITSIFSPLDRLFFAKYSTIFS